MEKSSKRGWLIVRLFRSLEEELVHNKTPEIFVDGVGRARFSGGVVRVDLVSATNILDDQNQAGEPELTHRLIMSPQGFLRMVQSMNNLVQELVSAGVITQQPPDSGSDSQDTATSEDQPKSA